MAPDTMESPVPIPRLAVEVSPNTTVPLVTLLTTLALAILTEGLQILATVVVVYDVSEDTVLLVLQLIEVPAVLSIVEDVGVVVVEGSFAIIISPEEAPPMDPVVTCSAEVCVRLLEDVVVAATTTADPCVVELLEVLVVV